MQLWKSHHHLPLDSLCTRHFLSHWYYSHHQTVWLKCDRQSQGLALKVTRVKGASTRPLVHISKYILKQEVSGVCMLWLSHQVVKTQEVHPSFWLVTDHLYPPKAGVGLQTAVLWDSAVKWDLQYFCVSECWVGIFKKKLYYTWFKKNRYFNEVYLETLLGKGFQRCVFV